MPIAFALAIVLGDDVTDEELVAMVMAMLPIEIVALGLDHRPAGAEPH